MTVSAWWSRSPPPGNLGDVLAPIVLEGLGVPVVWDNVERARLISIGSVIKFVRAGQFVWGSGLMWSTGRPDPGATYLAVRGPKTRDAIVENGGVAPTVLGDPALALPLFHDRRIEKVHDFGIVPHYVDEAEIRERFPTEKIISPLTADPLSVVDEIRSCRMIASSSLHGIVVAHAYGVPAGWMRFSDRLSGDDVKFEDYAGGVGIVLRPATTLDEFAPVTVAYDPEPLADALGPLR